MRPRIRTRARTLFDHLDALTGWRENLAILAFFTIMFSVFVWGYSL